MRTIFLLLLNYKIEVLEYILFLGVLFFFTINLHRHSRSRKDKYILSYITGILGIVVFAIGIFTFLTPLGLLLVKSSVIMIVGAVIAWLGSHILDLLFPADVAHNSNKYNLDLLTDILPKRKPKVLKTEDKS